jgi:hypothetical protein
MCSSDERGGMKLSDNAKGALLLAVTFFGPLAAIYFTGSLVLALAVFVLPAPLTQLVGWSTRVVLYGDHPFLHGRRNRRQGARMVDNPYRKRFSNGGLFSRYWWDLGWKSTTQNEEN